MYDIWFQKYRDYKFRFGGKDSIPLSGHGQVRSWYKQWKWKVVQEMIEIKCFFCGLGKDIHKIYLLMFWKVYDKDKMFCLCLGKVYNIDKCFVDVQEKYIIQINVLFMYRKSI